MNQILTTVDVAVPTHWITTIAGVRREFDAEITEQRPDERSAWRTLDPETEVSERTKALHGGVVTVHRLDELVESSGRETGSWRGEVPPAPQIGEDSSEAERAGGGAPAARGSGPGQSSTTTPGPGRPALVPPIGGPVLGPGSDPRGMS